MTTNPNTGWIVLTPGEDLFTLTLPDADHTVEVSFQEGREPEDGEVDTEVEYVRTSNQRLANIVWNNRTGENIPLDYLITPR